MMDAMGFTPTESPGEDSPPIEFFGKAEEKIPTERPEFTPRCGVCHRLMKCTSSPDLFRWYKCMNKDCTNKTPIKLLKQAAYRDPPDPQFGSAEVDVRARKDMREVEEGDDRGVM